MFLNLFGSDGRAGEHAGDYRNRFPIAMMRTSRVNSSCGVQDILLREGFDQMLCIHWTARKETLQGIATRPGQEFLLRRSLHALRRSSD